MREEIVPMDPHASRGATATHIVYKFDADGYRIPVEWVWCESKAEYISKMYKPSFVATTEQWLAHLNEGRVRPAPLAWGPK